MGCHQYSMGCQYSMPCRACCGDGELRSLVVHPHQTPPGVGKQEAGGAAGNASKVLAEPSLAEAVSEALPEDVALRCLADYNPLEREEYEEVRGACLCSSS